MSIGRVKSPSGEENFTLARNDVYDRGTMLKIRLSSSTNQVRSFVDGSCGRVEMGRCGDRPIMVKDEVIVQQ